VGGDSAGRYKSLVGNYSLHGTSLLIKRGLLETRPNPTYPAAQFLSQTRLELTKRFSTSPHQILSLSLHLDGDYGMRKQLRNSSKAYRMPSTNTAVYNAMTRCTGHSQDTPKMPSKPIQQCFEFHCLADWTFSHVQRPNLKTLRQNQPRRSILNLIPHSRSIAVDLVICLSICHR